MKSLSGSHVRPLIFVMPFTTRLKSSFVPVPCFSSWMIHCNQVTSQPSLSLTIFFFASLFWIVSSFNTSKNCHFCDVCRILIAGLSSVRWKHFVLLLALHLLTQTITVTPFFPSNTLESTLSDIYTTSPLLKVRTVAFQGTVPIFLWKIHRSTAVNGDALEPLVMRVTAFSFPIIALFYLLN